MKNVFVLTSWQTATLKPWPIPERSGAAKFLRWEPGCRCRASRVGHEAGDFIDRNVRSACPPRWGDRLRVQSAGGASNLLASEPMSRPACNLQGLPTNGHPDPASTLAPI